ncbi:MAG: Helix-turn-helix domain [Chloroflexota bacterium]|jgi:DNA-binding Xre family transcriptional regulator|nr:Helix-turn-helix domain [Chloroflexota bacterium]
MSPQEGDSSPDPTRHVRHTRPRVAVQPGSRPLSRGNHEAAPATPHKGPPGTTAGPQGGTSGGPGEPTSHVQLRSSYSVGSEGDPAPGRPPSGRSDRSEWLKCRTVPLDGAQLRQARWRQGLTQADCAQAAGLSATHWSALERGSATTPKTLRRLAEVLNCSPSDLLQDLGP